MGNRTCHNLRTDSGATFTNNTASFSKTQWNNSVYQCNGQQQMYLPANTTILMTESENELLDSMVICGDGKGMGSTIKIDGSWTGNNSKPVFLSVGRSNITFIGIRFTGNAKQMLAFLKFNSQRGGDTASKCKNITFYDCEFEDIWGNALQFGFTQDGLTHSIDNITIQHCVINRICNPAVPYLTDDNASDSDKCHGIDMGQTSNVVKILHNEITNCSGDGIRRRSQDTGIFPDYMRGNHLIEGNTIDSCWMPFEGTGNSYTTGTKLINNTFSNPTCNSGYCISIDGYNWSGYGNKCFAWENRSALELKGIQMRFDCEVTIYQKAHPNTATKRTAASYQSNIAEIYGFHGDWGIVGYHDWTGTKTSLAASRRCGFAIVGTTDSPGTQPQTWDGKDVAFDHDFSRCKVYGTTGPALMSENDTVVGVYNKGAAGVRVGNSFYHESSHQVETVIKIMNRSSFPGWDIDSPTLNVMGSAAATNGNYLIGVHTDLQGSLPIRSVINGLKTKRTSKWLNQANISGDTITGRFVDKLFQ